MGTSGEAELSRIPRKELGEYYMDVKMSGGNWQCDWGDGSCQEMEDEFDFAQKDNAERSNDFKYVFDVSGNARSACRIDRLQTDGNAWSSRFPRLMASHKSVVSFVFSISKY